MKLNIQENFICVPITETQSERFLAAVIDAQSAADAVELRLDYLTDHDPVYLLKLLSVKKESLSKPLILTHRPKEQGGQKEMLFNERLAFWRKFEAWDLIAFADIEADLVERLQQTHFPIQWEKVICSWHNFELTPEDLIQRYERMASTPAAIVKIATQCNRISDCLRLFELLEYAQGKKPVIVLGMGLPGLMTRVLALSRGALLTFGALRRGAESASGQPTVDELNNLYRVKQLSRTSEIYGVIGNPIGHSRSPLIHNPALQAAGIDSVYLPFEVDDAASFICGFVHPKTRKLAWNLRGLSVTIPHKLAVMPHLDWIDPTAQAIGAVNTIVVEGERLLGYNTDVHGAMQPLEELLDVRGAQVAVLGAGGAARAVCYGLRERGADITIYARDIKKAQPLADEFNARIAELANFAGPADLVINCTPIGMKGHQENASPVPAESLHGVKLVYDLVYNPEETMLLRAAKQAGCQPLGGLAMLVAQAAEQFRLFTGQDAPLDVMWQAVRQ